MCNAYNRKEGGLIMLDAERRIKQYIKERLDSRQKRLGSRILDERQKRDAACEICELKRLLKYIESMK